MRRRLTSLGCLVLPVWLFAAGCGPLAQDAVRAPLLRTDATPADAPLTEAGLIASFMNIALFYSPDDTVRLPTPLTRWAGPIRYRVLGHGVDAGARAEIGALMDRLAGLSGLEVAETTRPTATNFDILVFDEDEAEAYLAGIRDARGAHEAREIASVLATPDCGFIIFGTAQETFVIEEAITFHRAELAPDYLVQCFHEEIAQSLGLFNDDPGARPSIFNDDEEFALLTRHDELLVRILYDRRLEPGMTADTARPIVETIVRELLREVPEQ